MVAVEALDSSLSGFTRPSVGQLSSCHSGQTPSWSPPSSGHSSMEAAFGCPTHTGSPCKKMNHTRFLVRLLGGWWSCGCRRQGCTQLLDLLSLCPQQTAQVIDALGQGGYGVIWLARLLEIGELSAEQLPQPFALAAFPREAVPIQHAVAFHRLPAPLAGERHGGREPDKHPPERVLRQVREAEEPFDQGGRAIVVVQEPGDQWQQDLGLLPLRTEIRLADDQFPTLPVAFAFRVGPRLFLGQSARIEEECGRRLEASQWWMRETGQAAAVDGIGLLDQSAQCPPDGRV